MELRKIVFSREEVLSAVYDYCIRQHKPMPRAAVKHIEITTTSELMVRLIFDVPESDEDSTVQVGSADIAVAIIRLCSRIGVPLPRAARKALQRDGDGLAMIINLNYTQNPATDRPGRPAAA